MRKHIIPPVQENILKSGEDWLQLEHLAQVEITSEEAEHPVESALLSNHGEGWRAAGPGAQLLRLRFDTPQQLRRIHLRFTELTSERTQEFVLRYSSDHGQSFREIVRQQWNFSPWSAMREVEDYRVELSDVTVLELAINPDISGGNACASLAELRLA
jgi:hypothetical protein